MKLGHKPERRPGEWDAFVDTYPYPSRESGVSPLPWRIAGGRLYAADDSIVGDGAIREADNALIVEAVNARAGRTP